LVAGRRVPTNNGLGRRVEKRSFAFELDFEIGHPGLGCSEPPPVMDGRQQKTERDKYRDSGADRCPENIMPPAARAGAGAHSNKAAPSGSSGRDKYDMGVGRIFLRACSAGSHRRPPMKVAVADRIQSVR